MVNAEVAFELSTIEAIGVNKLNDLEKAVDGAIGKGLYKVKVERLDGQLIDDKTLRIAVIYLKKKGYKVKVEDSDVDFNYNINVSWGNL